MPRDEDTSPSPRTDLELALRGGCDLIGRLLTRGEVSVLEAWFDLPPPARSLYARLFGRRDRMVPVQGLADGYDEIPDEVEATRVLTAEGFAWTSPEHTVPVRWRLPLYARPELSRSCRALGLDHRGRRAALEERLIGAAPEARRLLDRPGIRLRHRGLMRRLCSVFLGRPDGDLRALVLQRMGTLRFATYRPTGGTGPFPDRRTLVAFEQERARARRVLSADTLPPEAVEHALALVHSARETAPEFRRFRAARYGARVARFAAESFERSDDHEHAALIWDVLCSPDRPDAASAARRWALCKEQLGDPAAGAQRCAAARATAGPADRLSLERTGRRLARQARVAWRPSPPLHPAKTRRLSLAPAQKTATRPRWDGELVEAAVAGTLQAAGRDVVQSENLLWTTLFGMILRDVLFAEVPEMLSGKLQMAPFDLGYPGFASRRRELLNTALQEVREDAGASRLETAFSQHAGEAIRGVSWSRWSQAQLLTVLHGLGGTLLAGVLEALAEGAARSGLPDLLVLDGPAVRLPGLFPGRVPAGVLAIEVKGPGDSLRDNQEVWLHRLLHMGVAAEIWEVRPTSSTEKAHNTVT